MFAYVGLEVIVAFICYFIYFGFRGVNKMGGGKRGEVGAVFVSLGLRKKDGGFFFFDGMRYFFSFR